MKPLALILSATVASIPKAPAQGFEKTAFESPSGDTLRYAILQPAKIEAGKNYPLVVALHGVGGRGAKHWERNCYANTVLTKKEMREKHPCFVIAPTVDKPHRWSGEPLKTLLELVDSLVAQHPIDPDRLYVTGQSMGGYGSFAAIVAKPELFAAAAPICGGHRPENAEKIAAIPIWVFHGDKDKTVPVARSREMVAALKEAGGKPKYTELEGVGHNAWTPAYNSPALWEWMFEQRRPAR